MGTMNRLFELGAVTILSGALAFTVADTIDDKNPIGVHILDDTPQEHVTTLEGAQDKLAQANEQRDASLASNTEEYRKMQAELPTGCLDVLLVYVDSPDDLDETTATQEILQEPYYPCGESPSEIRQMYRRVTETVNLMDEDSAFYANKARKAEELVARYETFVEEDREFRAGTLFSAIGAGVGLLAYIRYRRNAVGRAQQRHAQPPESDAA